MKSKVYLAILAATFWDILCEFLRNELMLKHMWVAHFTGLGLVFPSAPINNAMWGLWSLVFVVCLRAILTKFALVQGAILGWFLGFVLMWIGTANLSVLPLSILWYAVPLSLIEVFGAAWILQKIESKKP